MSSRNPSIDRQYSLPKEKKHRRSDSSARLIRLDDTVPNKGCVIRKIEDELRRQFPNLGIQRSGESLRVTTKSRKRPLYLLLDGIVANAINATAAIHQGKHNSKTAQDYKSERVFKRSTQQVAVSREVSTMPDNVEHDTTEIDAHTIASRVSSTAHGWFAVDPLALANELNEGMTIAAYPAI